ncbi:MAG TPA: transglutaminase domain-containing protein [Chryseosolibacter sp.]|nr:transglutaminase domain-containing protein [Chryseosolibacter sp.]
MKNLRMLVWGFLIVLSGCDPRPKVVEEKKESGQPVRKVSIDEIETGIKDYIEEETRKGDGYFHVKDKDRGLRMKLVRVHTEYLSNLGPKSHFACVDLADVSGDVYDVDFFLEGDPGAMKVTETTVHKLNGKPYYTWKQREDKTWHRVPVEGASEDLLGVIQGTDKFEFYYQATLPEMKEAARMWIPIAQSDTFQKVKVISIDVPGKQRTLEEKQYGNTILYVELGPEHSGETVEIRYEVERREKSPFVAQELVSDQYLKPNLLMPVGGRFKKIAADAIGEKRRDSKLMQARALYDYVIDTMRYMKHGNYGRGDAEYACDTRTGNCSEFHSFFISLARSAGIPSRFAIGASIPSDRNDGGIDGYHCWAEFYADGKWWPIDISEGNKYTALATYYFGRHPANRIELSRGRDLKVDPAPASGPINFLAFPLLEVGGEVVKTKNYFSFLRKGRAKENSEGI